MANKTVSEEKRKLAKTFTISREVIEDMKSLGITWSPIVEGFLKEEIRKYKLNILNVFNK